MFLGPGVELLGRNITVFSSLRGWQVALQSYYTILVFGGIYEEAGLGFTVACKLCTKCYYCKLSTLSHSRTSVPFPLQFSGENAERLKMTYGKFCGQHNQSVNYFKDLYTKDKRFQAFVKVSTWNPERPLIAQSVVSLSVLAGAVVRGPWQFVCSLAEEDEQFRCKKTWNPRVHIACNPADHQIPGFISKNIAVYQRWVSFHSSSVTVDCGCMSDSSRGPGEELLMLCQLSERPCFVLKIVFLSEILKCYVTR